MTKRRTFTPEFKLQVVLEMLSGRRTNAQLCREYQLAPAVISAWKEQFLEHAPAIFATPRSRSADQERMAELKQLIPEAFSEDKIDWEKLRAALGDLIDDGPERYTFSWAGKRDAIRLLQTPTAATLAPCAEESINFDTTRNVFIEGENLEALKLMLRPYHGQVKLICIDPPYNTGNDFVYSDDYNNPLGNYLRLTGQADARGNLLTSNPDNELQLVVKVQTEPNNTDDAAMLDEALPGLKERTDVDEMQAQRCADGGYNSPDVDETMREWSITQVQTAIRGRKPAGEKLSLDAFVWERDDKGQPQTVTCANGRQAEVKPGRKEVRYRAASGTPGCEVCPFLDCCPTEPLKRIDERVLRFSQQQVDLALHRQRSAAENPAGK